MTRKRKLLIALSIIFILFFTLSFWIHRKRQNINDALAWVEKNDGDVTKESYGLVDKLPSFVSDPIEEYFGRKIISVGIYNAEIVEVNRLQYFPDLQRIFLDGSHVWEIAGLQNLHEVQELSLTMTQVVDISALGSLESLVHLNLTDTAVTDLSPLKGLKLSYLSVAETKIKNLEAVKGLESLTYLNVSRTEIADLTPIAELKHLNKLELMSTNVTDLTPLKQIHSLKYLDIRDTKPVNLEALKDLKIEKLYISYDLLSDAEFLELVKIMPKETDIIREIKF